MNDCLVQLDTSSTKKNDLFLQGPSTINSLICCCCYCLYQGGFTCDIVGVGVFIWEYFLSIVALWLAEDTDVADQAWKTESKIQCCCFTCFRHALRLTWLLYVAIVFYCVNLYDALSSIICTPVLPHFFTCMPAMLWSSILLFVASVHVPVWCMSLCVCVSVCVQSGVCLCKKLKTTDEKLM